MLAYAFNSQLRDILHNRLELSSGTHRLDSDATRTRYYTKDACLPKSPWRSLRKDELTRYVASTGTFEPYQHVGVLQVSSLLEQIGVDPDLISERPDRIINVLSVERMTMLTMRLCEVLGSVGTPVIHGICRKQPQLETASINTRTGLFAGLHIDSWDGKTIAQRRGSRTRICLNLGPQSRHLLYAPIAMVDIPGEDSELDSPGALESKVLSDPDRPIARLRLEPFEAYVASTDTVIHDASTLISMNANYTFDFRVHIPAAVAAQ